MKIRFLFIVGMIMALGLVADEPKHNVKPKAGFVPDEQTAIAIAVAVWTPIYGEKIIQKEKPFKAELRDSVWHVYGTLPEGYRGGTVEAEMSKVDARILRVCHGR